MDKSVYGEPQKASEYGETEGILRLEPVQEAGARARVFWIRLDTHILDTLGYVLILDTFGYAQILDTFGYVWIRFAQFWIRFLDARMLNFGYARI